MNKVNLMLDLETLGTKPGCAILSIAAVPFGFHSPLEYFYKRALPDSNHDIGLHIDDATVAWWQKQDEVARKEAFGGTAPVMAILKDFVTYCELIKSECAAELILWGNGANFDEPIIAAALERIGISKMPWKYYNSLCYRTMKTLLPLKAIPPAVKHNALHDAKSQAEHMERMLKWLEAAAVK